MQYLHSEIKNKFELLKYMVEHSENKTFESSENPQLEEIIDHMQFNKYIAELRDTYIEVHLGGTYFLYDEAFAFAESSRLKNRILGFIKSHIIKIAAWLLGIAAVVIGAYLIKILNLN
ncbi:MAG: hypothetical protein E7476_03560 [Ruminococcaceae bacterium]|nr:hypothetical protein [Oscillospiraceae bacterium]